MERTRNLCGVVFAAVQRLEKEDSHPAGTPVRILDAPCGDFTWMPRCLNLLAQGFPTRSFEYQGVDISAVVIERRKSG